MGIVKYCLNMRFKQGRNFKGEIERRGVFVRLYRDNGLSRDAKFFAKIGLGPALGCAEVSKCVDHLRSHARIGAVTPKQPQNNTKINQPGA